MAKDLEELEPGTNEAFVNKRFDEILAKQFMSIENETGSFMLPVRKVGGVQQYVKLSVELVDGIMTLNVGQKFMVKTENETYSEVNA